MTYGLPTAPEEPYYAPGWPAARRRTDGFAVASFVTAVIGFGLVGVGLGIVALGRIRRGVTVGRGLAVAGVVIGLVWTLVQAVVVGSLVQGWLRSRPVPLAVDDARSAWVTQLATGHCLADLPDDGPLGEVEVVPCAERHGAQVLSDYRFAPDAVWPGQDQAAARVATACQLTEAETEAGLATVAWVPTEASWADGDRTGLCVAHMPGGFTGSLLDGTADLG
jgi:Domain of unknown function (DUF4190)/Septum formation